MQDQAVKVFNDVCEGWKVSYVKEYKPNSFLIIADGQVIKGQSFKMVLTRAGWKLDAIISRTI
jgi:hypothetical protein